MRYALLATLALALPVTAQERTERVISSPSKDIRLVTDRDETVKAFFNRNEVIVASANIEKGTPGFPGLEDIVEAKRSLKMFVSHPSFNADPEALQRYGMDLRVAPPSPAVVELLKQRPDKHRATLILRRGDFSTYHVVGYMAKGGLELFKSDAVNKADGFSPRDLQLIPSK